MVERTLLMVTTTCIGNEPSGTADAENTRVSELNFSQPGNELPVSVVTRMLALPLVAAELPATCSGSGKLKPAPAVAISLGTETVMIPACCTEGSRTSETEMPDVVAPAEPPPSPELDLAPVVPALGVPEPVVGDNEGVVLIAVLVG